MTEPKREKKAHHTPILYKRSAQLATLHVDEMRKENPEEIRKIIICYHLFCLTSRAPFGHL
jgi:hypothetical protein